MSFCLHHINDLALDCEVSRNVFGYNNNSYYGYSESSRQGQMGSFSLIKSLDISSPLPWAVAVNPLFPFASVCLFLRHHTTTFFNDFHLAQCFLLGLTSGF